MPTGMAYKDLASPAWVRMGDTLSNGQSNKVALDSKLKQSRTRRSELNQRQVTGAITS